VKLHGFVDHEKSSLKESGADSFETSATVGDKLENWDLVQAQTSKRPDRG
jgi:hypothetical protein